MALVVASIVLLHVVSLACLLIVSRHSVMLVDEDGRPVFQAGGWKERLVPRQHAPSERRRERT